MRQKPRGTFQLPQVYAVLAMLAAARRVLMQRAVIMAAEDRLTWTPSWRAATISARSGATRPRTFKRLHESFLLVFGIVTALLCLPLLLVNITTDPLWYFTGNRWDEQHNLVLNERVSKTNALVREPDAFDCLILGSSRTTLLSPHSFEASESTAGYRCFNYAVSQASFRDLVSLGRFARSRRDDEGRGLLLVVVGVDAFNLSHDTYHGEQALPAYVSELESPPPFLTAYLAHSSFELSLQTLQGDSPLPRYYEFADDVFVARIPTSAKRYSPPSTLLLRPSPTRRFDQFPQDGFEPQLADGIAAFEMLFPNARLLGYAPPVKPEYSRKLSAAGTLDDLLDSYVQAARYFDEFYDFSAPSELTMRFSETPDGSHYSAAVNDVVARRLLGERGQPGLRVLSEDYRAAYHRRVDEHARAHPLEVVRGGVEEFRNE